MRGTTPPLPQKPSWRGQCHIVLSVSLQPHTFVSEGLLKHFPRFSSSFPEYEANLHTHTRCSSKPFIFTALKNRKPVTALVYFSGCSSLTGSDRVMRQEALCYQRLPLVSVTSRSAFRSLVQALRAQSGLLLTIPCIYIPQIPSCRRTQTVL
jgi:hypothetical protein